MKKWRDFLEGGNDIRVFLQKGKPPPTIEPEQEQEQEQVQEQEQEPEQEQQVRKCADRYIYFPLEIISIERFRPYQISIQK